MYSDQFKRLVTDLIYNTTNSMTSLEYENNVKSKYINMAR